MNKSVQNTLVVVFDLMFMFLVFPDLVELLSGWKALLCGFLSVAGISYLIEIWSQLENNN